MARPMTSVCSPMRSSEYSTHWEALSEPRWRPSTSTSRDTMPESTASTHFSDFLMGFQPLWNILNAQSSGGFSDLRVDQRRMVAEAAIFLHDLMERVGLTETESEFAKGWIAQCIHVLGRGLEQNFVLQFYYFRQNYKRSPGGTTNTMMAFLTTLRALEVCGSPIGRRTTIWRYIERDIPYFRGALDEAIQEDVGEHMAGILFLLLNTIDFVASVSDSDILRNELLQLCSLAERQQVAFT